jgi:hypothetical protein
MDYNMNSLIPFIPPSEYDKVAQEFLEEYCPEALRHPMAIPIEKIAEDMGLMVQYVCLSEETDIYGATIFTDGVLEIYDPEEGLYDKKFFKRKTVLIDSEAVKKTNVGCKHNTLAHECIHWYKHRWYYKMQQFTMPRMARFCKCSVNQLPNATEDENIMEGQAVGIAPRILMPKETFIEAANHYDIVYGRDNWQAIYGLADLFDVSKQSVIIRLEECNLL